MCVRLMNSQIDSIWLSFFAHFKAQETKVTEEHILCMLVVFSEYRLQSLKSEKIER